MKDAELLKLCNKRLIYDSDTGIFTNQAYRSPNSLKGKVAGCSNNCGYWQIMISGKLYHAHRLAFLMIHEYMPQFVDHKNGVKSDNWINNLRECTSLQNSMNRGPQKNNKSGYKGVSWHKTYSKWAANIKVNGKIINLGRFEDKTDAAKAYNNAVKKHFPEFGYLNKIEVV